ncbi:hypothetical protein LINGRAHAP2_LOCUS18902 [Linum grandiflorum]
MNQEGDHQRRTLADLPPDLLKLIISKLISGDGPHRFKVGDKLGYRERELSLAGIPAGIRKQVSLSTIVCKFRDEGWLLLHQMYGSDPSSCCFNPFLPWPACFVPLPTLDIESLYHPMAAAFSASPVQSGGDLRILVFHSGCLFSVVRIRRGREDRRPLGDKYAISGGKLRDPVAADYMEDKEGGKFFVLFKCGDILVWGAEGVDGLRKMLVAKQPIFFLSSAKYLNTDHLLCAVGESLVMIWSRPSSSSWYRLVSTTESENHRHDDRIKQLEEGRMRRGTTDTTTDIFC